MNNTDRELLLDLLTKQATEGLDADEARRLAVLEGSDDDTFDLVAARIMLSGLPKIEPMPASLRAKIAGDAQRFFDEKEELMSSDLMPVTTPARSSGFSWLGWAIAAAAVLALGINIAMTRFGVTEIARNPTPTTTPTPMTPEEAHDKMMAEPGMTIARWGSPENDAALSGDVVWSDKQQKGFMKFRGLPKNDPEVSTYQLWIFEQNQGDKTPIDGGTFNVSSNGEVVIPIDAKLTAKNPKMFAVTVEKPGGVVVSKREKIAALAKVETSGQPDA